VDFCKLAVCEREQRAFVAMDLVAMRTYHAVATWRGACAANRTSEACKREAFHKRRAFVTASAFWNGLSIGVGKVGRHWCDCVAGVWYEHVVVAVTACSSAWRQRNLAIGLAGGGIVLFAASCATEELIADAATVPCLFLAKDPWTATACAADRLVAEQSERTWNGTAFAVRFAIGLGWGTENTSLTGRFCANPNLRGDGLEQIQGGKVNRWGISSTGKICPVLRGNGFKQLRGRKENCWDVEGADSNAMACRL
jgi:hypothetical protein